MKTDNAFPGAGLRAFISVLLLSATLLILAGCRQTMELPPVIVSKPVCLLVSAHDTFSHAGVSFKCSNTGNRSLSSLEVSFLVFTDAAGGNPLYGSNVVRAEVAAALAAGETSSFEISLDDRLACIPVTPFLIDGFYIRKAVFADGSEWRDPLGMYYAGSLP